MSEGGLERRHAKTGAWGAASIAILSFLVGSLSSLGVSLLPLEVIRPYVWWVWGVTALASAVAAGLAYTAARNSTAPKPEPQVRAEGTRSAAIRGDNNQVTYHEDRSSHTHLHAFATPSVRPTIAADKLVVGQIPAEPLGWIPRDELDDLGVVLARHRYVVCLGGRGSGKSAYAASYARTVLADAANARVIVWLSGETQTELVSGLEALAKRLGVEDPDGNAIESAEAARDHLSALSDPSLLVIDNAEVPDEIDRWVPSGACRVVLTSTDRQFANRAFELAVGTFERRESIDYLIHRTGIENDPGGADDVAEELGDLPLALAQAAAVIRSQQLEFAEYTDKLRNSTVAGALLKADSYPRGLAEAVLLSVNAAIARDARVVSPLDAIAVLDPAGVPKQLLVGVVGHLDTGGDEGVESGDDLDVALGVLADSSLTTWSVGGSAVVMHRLVARVVRETRTVPWRSPSSSPDQYVADVAGALASPDLSSGGRVLS